MAKNEIPFYTTDANISGASFAASTATVIFTAGLNGAKLLSLSFFDSDLTNAGVADSTVKVKVIINNGSGDKNVFTYSKTNPTISTKFRLDNENILDGMSLPKDRNGNKYILLKAGATVKLNYSTSGTAGAIENINGFGAYGEDF